MKQKIYEFYPKRFFVNYEKRFIEFLNFLLHTILFQFEILTQLS